MTAEVMNTPEFRDVELQIREEKLLRIKWDEKRKRSMEKQRYRAKMERPRINYIPKGLSVDYEEEYSKYLIQEVSFEPRDNDDFTAGWVYQETDMEEIGQHISGRTDEAGE